MPVVYSNDCECNSESCGDTPEGFAFLRNKCSALNQILIPDAYWADFQEAAQEQFNEAYHRPILLLAYQRGYLSRLTSPIHQFLLSKSNVRADITTQYKNDLIEKWMLKKGVFGRHETSRIYLGRLSEMIVARMLAQNNWSITNLEAWGGDIDIECTSPSGKGCAIEVKYIGQDSDSFDSVVKSLKGENSIYGISPYASSDFLIFKIYTAAKQLLQSHARRIACIVISLSSWQSHFEIPLKNGWIKWDSPTFFNNDPTWNRFLQNKKRDFPEIEKDLSETIRSLSEIWIMREVDNFIYNKHSEYKYPISA